MEQRAGSNFRHSTGSNSRHAAGSQQRHTVPAPHRTAHTMGAAAASASHPPCRSAHCVLPCVLPTHPPTHLRCAYPAAHPPLPWHAPPQRRGGTGQRGPHSRCGESPAQCRSGAHPGTRSWTCGSGGRERCRGSSKNQECFPCLGMGLKHQLPAVPPAASPGPCMPIQQRTCGSITLQHQRA